MVTRLLDEAAQADRRTAPATGRSPRPAADSLATYRRSRTFPTPHRRRSPRRRAAPSATWCHGAPLVPHAGYVYSGRVAASAYRHLTAVRGRFRRVVLIGPAHFVPVQGVAVSAASGFETALGVLPVDEAGRAAALEVPGVSRDDAPHEPEHSLEVQLPFILETIGAVPIVPLLVGRAGTAHVADLLDTLWTPDSLLLVSSDLSHYLDVAAARARDSLTVSAILHRDAAGIADSDACGSYAVRPLLATAAGPEHDPDPG